MARTYPFRAWRFNPVVIRLDDAIIQPGDKVTPALQAYYQKSPYNLVRIILGLPDLFDAKKGQSVYTRAAGDFRRWHETGPCNSIALNPKLLSGPAVYPLD